MGTTFAHIFDALNQHVRSCQEFIVVARTIARPIRHTHILILHQSPELVGTDKVLNLFVQRLPF